MSISEQVLSDQKPLNSKKLEKLRTALETRKISTVKPSRPDRNGINSEVVIEKKLAHGKCSKKKSFIFHDNSNLIQPLYFFSAKSLANKLKATKEVAVEQKVSAPASTQISFNVQPKPQQSAVKTITSTPQQQLTITTKPSQNVQHVQPSVSQQPLSLTTAAKAPVSQSFFSNLPAPSFGLPKLPTPNFTVDGQKEIKGIVPPISTQSLGYFGTNKSTVVEPVKSVVTSSDTPKSAVITQKSESQPFNASGNTQPLGSSGGFSFGGISGNKPLQFGSTPSNALPTSIAFGSVTNKIDKIDKPVIASSAPASAVAAASNKENILKTDQKIEQPKPVFSFVQSSKPAETQKPVAVSKEQSGIVKTPTRVTTTPEITASFTFSLPKNTSITTTSIAIPSSTTTPKQAEQKVVPVVSAILPIPATTSSSSST